MQNVRNKKRAWRGKDEKKKDQVSADITHRIVLLGKWSATLKAY